MKELKISNEFKKEYKRLLQLEEAIEKFEYDIPEDEPNYDPDNFKQELAFNEFLWLKVLYPVQERWGNLLFGELEIWTKRGVIKRNIAKLKAKNCEDFNIDFRECVSLLGVNVFFQWQYKLGGRKKTAVQSFYVDRLFDKHRKSMIKEFQKYSNEKV